MYPSDSLLGKLESLTRHNPDSISRDIAMDFRARRIEKNLTRKDIADRSGVALSNIARFEQTGLISLRNLIRLAMALGYTSEILHVFSDAKYSNMRELTKIHKNAGKKRAYPSRKSISAHEKDNHS